MQLTLVAYAYVVPHGDKPECSRQEVSPEIERYLEGHLQDLFKRADRGSAPPARFSADVAAGRFETLRTGSPEAFQRAAQELAETLQGRMDGRTKRGFLVALRTSGSSVEARSAVLKLDIHDEIAASARRTESGDLLLEAVQDLLDLHGELQKGAIYPDPRPESQVLVGDKVAADASLYFLETLQVQQFASALSAGPAFLGALAKVNEAKAPLLATLLNAEEEATSPESFLSKHSSMLTPDERAMVLSDIRDRQRPVQALPARKRPLKELIRADGIEVSGRAEDVQNKVSIEESNDGWLISIRVQSKPIRDWK